MDQIGILPKSTFCAYKFKPNLATCFVFINKCIFKVNPHSGQSQSGSYHHLNKWRQSLKTIRDQYYKTIFAVIELL